MNSDTLVQELYSDLDQNTRNQLFDFLPKIYYFVKNCNGQFVQMNQFMMDAFDFREKNDFVGKNDYQLFPAEHAKRVCEVDKEVIYSEHEVKDLVERVDDGRSIDRNFVTSKFPLFNRRGEVCGIQAIMRECEEADSSHVKSVMVKEIVKMIEANYMNKISIDDLAKDCNMSRSTLDRMFKLYYKISINRFITCYRIDQAKHQLADMNKTIESIAKQVGFCDSSSFGKEFKKITKQTPFQYRSELYK